MTGFQKAVVWVMGSFFIVGSITMGWGSAWVWWSVDKFLGNLAATLSIVIGLGLWARYIYPFFMGWIEGGYDEYYEDEEEDDVPEDPFPVQRPLEPIKIVVEENDREFKIANLSISPRVLGIFVREVSQGRSLRQSEWAGPGKPLTWPEYSQLWDQLSSGGFIARGNPDAKNSPYRLTPAGEALVKNLSSLPTGTSRAERARAIYLASRLSQSVESDGEPGIF